MPNCYLCGQPEQEVVRTKLRHDLRRNVLKCPTCALVWLEPQESNLDDYYREAYRQLYTAVPGQEVSPEENFQIYLPFMGERVERVQRHLDHSMRVLEVGCATGHFLAAIEPLVGERVGLELNEAHAAFARRKLGVQVYAQPIETTDCPKHSFDVIFMFQVLEHIPDPIGFVRGLADYLTPRGKLYIEVPNIDDALISSYAVEGYADFYYREPHLYYFSSKTFRTVMERGGFMGEIEMAQPYSILNHMHWVTTGKPQASAELGMRVPQLLPNSKRPGSDFEVELQDWLEQMDREYRSLLKRHGRADSMAFVGGPADGLVGPGGGKSL